MATAAQWLVGARLRTLPVAVAPVLAGTGAAAGLGHFVPAKAVLCLVVALALQVGVNYANDYSDGIRGTDADRVGPQRLVGSGAATPATGKRAAFLFFGLAGVAGVVLAVTTAWWLLLLGAAAVGAAWFYTGGTRPYGYRGLGEISVFVFFGLAAVLGTTYSQAQTIGRNAVLAAVAAGLLACAVLVANNLRDIPTDRLVGKRTLSVMIGDRASRALYIGMVLVGLLAPLAMTTPWALLAWAAIPLAVPAVLAILRQASGMALIRVLKLTGLTELLFGAALALGLAIAA
ncbi:MAG: 1,4-dihydroxy-2-naphthoate polyprenyltransferase [Jatrophihabitans sp.]